MEPKWTIVKGRKSSKARQGQKTSLVQSAKAKEVKEEMWREEDFDKPDFLIKVSPKLTRGEKKKKRQMRLKNLQNQEVNKTKEFHLNMAEFPPLYEKKRREDKVEDDDVSFKEFNLNLEELKIASTALKIASQQELNTTMEYKLIKRKIKKEKQRLKKAITKRLKNIKSQMYEAKKERLEKKDKKQEAVSSFKESETKSGLHGGAPPKKIPLVVPGLDEQILNLEEQLKNFKCRGYSDTVRKNFLLNQLAKLQEKKKEEKAPMKNDFSNFHHQFENFVPQSETSSVTGEVFSQQEIATDTSSVAKGPTTGDSPSSVSMLDRELNAKILALSNPNSFTCYMNAAYSMLSIIPEFVELLNRAPSSQIITELKNVFNTKNQNSILRIMYRTMKIAKLGKQQDAAEFMKCLLEKLTDVIPVASLFNVAFKETSTCFKGNHGEGSSYSNSQVENELLYRVTVPHSPTELQDIVNNSLDKTSKYPCRVCGGEEYFNDHRNIIDSKPYLIIELRRSTDGETKNHTEVKTSGNHLSFNKKAYKIIGAISHIGDKATSGHYTSQVYFQAKWWEIDDDHVTEIAEPSLGGATVILLQEDLSKSLEELNLSTPAKVPSMNRPSVIMATPKSQIKSRVESEALAGSRRLDFQETQETDTEPSSQENIETVKKCFCDESSHSCIICKERVCNFCSIAADPDNDLKRMHPDCERMKKQDSASSSSSMSRHMSPAKKVFLQRHMEQEEIQRLETIQEEEIQNQIISEQAREEASFKFVGGSTKNVIFCGQESQVEWLKENLSTLYVIVPGQSAFMVRVDKQCQANISDLQSYLLMNNLVDSCLSYSKITFKGEVLQDQQLHKLDKSCLIYSHEPIKEHGGYFWSCSGPKCRNPQMMGSMRHAKFHQNHSKQDCNLFEKKLLEGKTSWGDSYRFDRGNRPYGHPTVDGKPTRVTKKYLQTEKEKNTEKEIEVFTPVPVQNEKRSTRPRKKRVVYSESEESGSDNEKECQPTLALQDSSQDSDTDKEIQKPKNKKVRRDKKVSNIQISKKGKIKKQMKSVLDYDIPDGWQNSGLLEAKLKRRQDMIDVRLQGDDSDDFSWKKSETETAILREKIISKVYKKSARFEVGQAELHPESIAKIMKGQKPLKEDMYAVPKTVDLYEEAANRLMDMFQKKKKMKLSFGDFFCFDRMEKIIYPSNIINDLEEYQVSVGVKQHMLYVYILLVGIQSVEAEQNFNKFSSLVRGAETLTEAQLVSESRKEAGHFMSLCTSTLQNLRTGAHAINKNRMAQALHNRRVATEISKVQTPNPVHSLPLYFESAEVKALDTLLLTKATTDEEISANELKELTNHVVVALSLKGGVRIQVITSLTHREYLDALSRRQMFFPFEPKENNDNDDDGEEDEDIEQDKFFCYNPNRRVDVPEQEAGYLKGVLVEKVFHKTTLKGTAKLWLSKADLTRINCYRAVVKKYAESHNKVYNQDGPIFVNKDLNDWSCGGKRQPNYTIWSKICGIQTFHSHMTRRMFASFAAVQKNLLIRELAAMASSHSVATQQARYRTEALQQIQAVEINAYYRKQCKIIEEEMNQNAALPFISDKYSEELRQDLQEAMKKKEEHIHRLEEAKDKSEEVRGGTRSLTANMKYQIMQLIIHADDKFARGKHNLNLHLANDLMTGKNIINAQNKRNILLLLDLVSVKEETKFLSEDLIDHLLEVTGYFASIDKESSNEDFVTLVENQWTNTIVNMFKNLSDPDKTTKLKSERLKKLLADYNKTRNYEYCFNNKHISYILELYNTNKQQESENLDRICAKDKQYTAVDALKSLADQAKKQAEKERVKQSQQMDIEAEKRRNDFFENIPDTDATIREVNNETPKKGCTIETEDMTIRITPKTKRAICEGDNTPAKLRRGPTYTILSKPGSGKSGRSEKINWSNSMRVQFLGLWIDWSEKPFLKDHLNQPNTKDYRNDTFKQMMTKTHLICTDKKGKTVKKLLGEITNSTDTLNDNLLKPKILNKKALEYLDKKMEEKCGHDSTKWTPKQARQIKDELLEDLYNKIGDRPRELDSDTDADDEA